MGKCWSKYLYSCEKYAGASRPSCSTFLQTKFATMPTWSCKRKRIYFENLIASTRRQQESLRREISISEEEFGEVKQRLQFQVSFSLFLQISVFLALFSIFLRSSIFVEVATCTGMIRMRKNESKWTPNKDLLKVLCIESTHAQHLLGGNKWNGLL